MIATRISENDSDNITVATTIIATTIATNDSNNILNNSN